jgi:hypothetical protein
MRLPPDGRRYPVRPNGYVRFVLEGRYLYQRVALLPIPKIVTPHQRALPRRQGVVSPTLGVTDKLCELRFLCRCDFCHSFSTPNRVKIFPLDNRYATPGVACIHERGSNLG